MLKLYSYWRSSSAYRVRIALNLKQLSFEYLPIHLLKGGGEQYAAEYQKVNPQGLVPALDDGGFVVRQSIAIIEYLDETRPDSPLLPSAAKDRAWVRAIVQSIACEIQPSNNLRVQGWLKSNAGLGQNEVEQWMHHWMDLGFSSIESVLAQRSKATVFCAGDKPGMAEAFLIPQLYNARRVNMDLSAYPIIMAINDAALTRPEFQRALPENQPDAAG